MSEIRIKTLVVGMVEPLLSAMIMRQNELPLSIRAMAPVRSPIWRYPWG